MKEEVLHIATNIDDNYLTYCAVMLTSLFVNNPNTTFSVHILSQGLQPATIQSLEQCVRGFGNHHQLCFHTIDGAVIDRLPQYENGHISPAANCRLFAAELLPAHLTKVLYLDCDLLILDKVDALFQLDLKDYAVAAVEDMWSGKNDNYERLGYDSQYTYFNSGVMMINLEWWRQHQIEQSVSAFLSTPRNLKYIDQDILNAVLHRHWLQLPLVWNVQDGFLRKKTRIRESKLNEMLHAAKKPSIVHYTGGKKPWHSRCLNPYRHLFFQYLDQTQWKGWRPELSLGDRFHLFFGNILTALWLKPRKYRNDLRVF